MIHLFIFDVFRPEGAAKYAFKNAKANSDFFDAPNIMRKSYGWHPDWPPIISPIILRV